MRQRSLILVVTVILATALLTSGATLARPATPGQALQPPGGVVTATLALTEPAGLAGLGLRFWAIADAGGTVAEGNETNNTGYDALDARPDLTLDACDIAGEGPIVVTVRNAGVVTAMEVAPMVWSGSFSCAG